MLQLKEECYSIVALETSWNKETCIHLELGNFIFFPIWFGIVLYINRWFVSNERHNFFPLFIYDYKKDLQMNLRGGLRTGKNLEACGDLQW